MSKDLCKLLMVITIALLIYAVYVLAFEYYSDDIDVWLWNMIRRSGG